MAILRFVDKTLSVFVGNLSTVVPHEEVEEVIYELFLQVSLFRKKEPWSLILLEASFSSD